MITYIFVYQYPVIMKKVLFIAALTFYVAIISCNKSNNDQHDPKPDIPISDSLEVMRRTAQDKIGQPVSSLSVYIQTPDRTIFATSNHPDQTPITADTYFRFASITKNFTSTAVLNMHEEGWLSIYDNITDVIPGAQIPYVPDTQSWNIPYKLSITIEQLLQHSAGVYDVDNDPVPNYEGESYVEYTFHQNPTHQFTTEELVNQLALYNLSYWEPGFSHHYSNTGYTILSEIIARVYTARHGSVKTYGNYLYDYVYGPHTPVPLDIYFPELANDITINGPHAIGTAYYLPPLGTIHYDQSNMSAHVAEGNGYANFTYLNTYVRSLMKGQNVLDAATINLMQTNFSPDTSGHTSYGLGCSYVPNLGYGHNGCIRGYLSLMLYDPVSDVSLIAMINTVDNRSDEGFNAVAFTLYDAAAKVREMLGYPGKPR